MLKPHLNPGSASKEKEVTKRREETKPSSQ
jgi:hypothetical protein